jgi:hypothetical protein
MDTEHLRAHASHYWDEFERAPAPGRMWYTAYMRCARVLRLRLLQRRVDVTTGKLAI